MPSPLRRRPRGSAGGDGRRSVPSAQDEARRRVRRGRITLVVVAVVVVLALGVAIGFFAPAALLEPSTPSSAWDDLGLGLVLVGLATVVIAGVRARRGRRAAARLELPHRHRAAGPTTTPARSGPP